MKKLTKVFMAALIMAQGVSCSQAPVVADVSETPAPPAMTEQEITNNILSPEVMLKMRRIGGTALSPDGKTLVYSLGVQDIENNGSYSNLISINTATKEETALTEGTSSYSSPSWSADGGTIYYMTGGQLWKMHPDGSGKTQISNIEGGMSGYQVSPKDNMVLYYKSVKVDETKDDMYPSYTKSGARIYDDLMVRHWDYWTDGTYLHPFVADMVNGKLANDRDIIAGEAWDVPNAPYFSGDELSWNNAGTIVAYTAKKETGTEYSLSTNTDIYLYDVATGETENITLGMPGYDKYPVFSEDDSEIAFSSMRRAGNEADKTRLMVYNMKDKSIRDLSANFDNNTESYIWNGDYIYFLAPLQATGQICRVNTQGTPEVEVLTNGDHTIGSFMMSNGVIVANITTISSSNELYLVNDTNYAISPLTEVNKSIYDNVTMGEVQKRWVKTTDSKQMLVWVILPPNFDANKKYPTLLYCQGGPQSTVANQWSYRWNFQLMAAQGYVVVAPNRRGLPSFGQEWLDQISGDYSGQNIKDYLSAIDDVAKESWADETRMGCVGASYGGYSAYFLMGNHEERFKAFISHCGMFNLESFYGMTEELWFPTNDLGGSPYSDSPVAKRSYANSPHKFVKNWDSPILIITGEKDYRIPYTQSLEAFTAARLMGLDARLISFSDEAHQVFKPQNALVWHSEFFRWLDKYLK